MHERTHTGIKPLQCEHCGKRFSESSNLSKHRRMHQEEKEKKSYKCDFAGCGKAFVRFASLKNHKKEAHAGTDRGGSTALETDSEGPGEVHKNIASEVASNDSWVARIESLGARLDSGDRPSFRDFIMSIGYDLHVGIGWKRYLMSFGLKAVNCFTDRLRDTRIMTYVWYTKCLHFSA